MKNLKSKRKGFTIVELVIVIAVIGILAAILIPTFVNITKKANMSADEVAVRNMNTLLATEFVKEKPSELKEVVDILDKNGYNVNSLSPISAGYTFVWNKETNKIELIKSDSITDKLIDLSTGSSFINVKVGTKEELMSALNRGNDVTLTNNITVSDTFNIIGDVTIDMNKFSLNAASNTSRPFNLTNGSTLTINAEGSNIICGNYGLVNIPAGNSGTVVLNGGNYTANTDNGSFIKVRTGEVTKDTIVNVELNNVNYVDSSNDGYIITPVANDRTSFLGKLNITINGGSYQANSGIQTTGTATIKNATIKTKGFGIAVEGGKATVENCNITVGNHNDGASASPIAVSNNATVTVKKSKLYGNGETIAAYYAYTSGGTIIAEENTVDLTTFKNENLAAGTVDLKNYPDAKILIKVDGVVKLEK